MIAGLRGVEIVLRVKIIWGVECIWGEITHGLRVHVYSPLHLRLVIHIH